MTKNKWKKQGFNFTGLALLPLLVMLLGLFAWAADDDVPPDEESLKYAVIVVGANQSDPENMHFAFDNGGERLYNTLIAKSFTHDNIYYLSWDPGNPNVDALAYKANIQWALDTWMRNKLSNGAENETAVIYFIDHGGVIGGVYKFEPYDNPPNEITDFELNHWIAKALTEASGERNYGSATIVIETCKSGWMLNPPWTLTGPGRIVVTATDSTLDAYSWWDPPLIWLLQRPADSYGEPIFSYYFLKSIGAGADVYQAFKTAYYQTTAEVIRLANLSGGTERQNPQVNDQHYTPLYW